MPNTNAINAVLEDAVASGQVPGVTAAAANAGGPTGARGTAVAAFPADAVVEAEDAVGSFAAVAGGSAVTSVSTGPADAVTAAIL